MKKHLFFIVVIFSILNCSPKINGDSDNVNVEDTVRELDQEALMLKKVANHESKRMQFKLVQSKFTNESKKWKVVQNQLLDFGESDYMALYPLIYEKEIPEIQSAVESGKLTYKRLTQWYLYRILKIESNDATTLNAIISIMPNAVELAEQKDNNKPSKYHPVFGMPILLKDNINAAGAATTAGAIALSQNHITDATIVSNLRSNGAIILGKVNLSEWAYYFCDNCPLGYSAVGGQSLNPYGRGVFETGGSSAGSGTSMAGNYAAGAVGTETSGSILSPSSQNSVFGLKPTIGVLSRSGIVPISSTLDTPGPMTRSVIDNAILLSAMSGQDAKDPVTLDAPKNVGYLGDLGSVKISDVKFGTVKGFLENDLYAAMIERISQSKGNLDTLELPEFSYEGFLTILNYDMKHDMPIYLNENTSVRVQVKTLSDIIRFNKQDSMMRAPYGQGRFIASDADVTTDEDMNAIKERLENESRASFSHAFDEKGVDVVLSINNYSASAAAVAKYPCLAIPMGYTDAGEPMAITLVGKPYSEKQLLQIAYAIESEIDMRKPPSLIDE